MSSMVGNVASSCAAALGPRPATPGIPFAREADEGDVVGELPRFDLVAVLECRSIGDGVGDAVPDDDLIVANRLEEIGVGCTDDDALISGVGVELRGRRREAVVGLVADHGPQGNSERAGDREGGRCLRANLGARRLIDRAAWRRQGVEGDGDVVDVLAF